MHPRPARRSLRAPARLVAAALVAACTSAPSVTPAPAVPPRDLVVLVHGMGRTPLSMRPLARVLEQQGYDVLNWDYSSTGPTVAELGTQLAAAVRERPRAPGARVHFVTHSLGGIVVRAALASDPPPDVGRVVMLAPPNQGARAADAAQPWVGWWLKPLSELGTGDGSTARTLPVPPGVEIGVIAGGFDGKVSVEETHLAGETDHVVVPGTHSFLMLRSDVQGLVLGFLATGHFAAN
ncbi:MAG TPA: alpha/beta fold hydrolase [Planctomycetota bacterium]|nr:alpha/beta fold hydrolase [Planctomycetota bacterium]